MKRAGKQRPAGQPMKKTRFVSPEEDPARFEEGVEAQLESAPSAARRRRVRVEGYGYESDSSDEGESVVRSRRGRDPGADGAERVEEEEEMDMFVVGGDDEEEGGGAGGSGAPIRKKKKKEYLRLGDIEGQEFNDAPGSSRENGRGRDDEDDDVSEEEDEPEDEDDAERRKKVGMGYEISSFNMREEMEEGKFTAEGNYERKRDPHAIHDRWLEGTDEHDVKKARRAKRAQERKEREKQKAEAIAASQSGSKEDIEKEMLTIMKRSETVLETLARLGDKAKREKARDKGNKINTKHANEMDNNAEHKPAALRSALSKAQTQIERLTALASNLLSLGDVDIYDKTYEHLLRSVRSVGNVEPDWMPPPPTYEYRWDVSGAQTQDATELQVFGPFSEDEMKTWFNANYFGISGEKVKVRMAGGEWGDWDNVVD